MYPYRLYVFQVALSIKLLATMKLFFKIRSVQNLHLAAFKADKISVPHMLRDEGFERIKFFTPLKRKIRVYFLATAETLMSTCN